MLTVFLRYHLPDLLSISSTLYFYYFIKSVLPFCSNILKSVPHFLLVLPLYMRQTRSAIEFTICRGLCSSISSLKAQYSTRQHNQFDQHLINRENWVQCESESLHHKRSPVSPWSQVAHIHNLLPHPFKLSYLCYRIPFWNPRLLPL